MWLGLLGPLHVQRDDEVIPVPAAKQRIVLATLLVQSNQVVSLDELTDAVWGGNVPRAARATLRNYVKRLRSGLGQEMAARIRTHNPGYRIDLSETELDLALFTKLYVEGGAAIQAGRWDEAERLLRRALGLWRGAPLADVPSEMLRRGEVPRLEQVRLQALEWRLDAQLHLGRHQEAVPQLHALVTQFPLRERLHAYLMLALYRCGRQADALAVYRGIRRTLVDELAVEPGPELQALQHRVLVRDPRLWDSPVPPHPGAEPVRPLPSPVAGAAGQQAHAAEVARPAPVRTPPRQLPPVTRYFAGRTVELRALTALLDRQVTTAGAVVISAIGGAAGVGKTALALHWAHQVAGRFPHGQLYADLRGFGPSRAPVTPAEAVREFLTALGVRGEAIPASPEAQVGLYRSLLADRSVLVVLDNARDAEQVRPLVPSGPGCLTVVTSRDQLTGLVASGGANVLTLDTLTDTEAAELLAGRLGADRLTGEPAAVTDLIKLCAGLPLALSIAAAHAATNPRLPLASVAADLRQARLDALATRDIATDVRAVFSWSYRNLSEPGARMFRLLGMHPGPDITAPGAASLAGVPLAAAHGALAELAGAHLLTQYSPGRFTCHDLLRVYAAEQGEAGENRAQRRAAVRRILDHYLHTAHAADRLLDPLREQIALARPAAGVTTEEIASYGEALAWFRAERRVLYGAVALAARSGLGTHAWQLGWAQATYFKRYGDWHDWAAMQRTALAAASQGGQVEGQAHAWFDLGRAALRLGTYPDALGHLRQALGLFTSLGDRVGQARSHIELGRAFRELGHVGTAMDHARQALELAEGGGHQVVWAGALNNIGYYHAHLGDYEKALARCQQALAMFRELGCRSSEAQTLDSVGYVYHLLGRHNMAVGCFRRALHLLRELGSRSELATLLTHLGDALGAAGDAGAARAAWQQALDILDELDHPGAEAVRAKLG
jgi:DNA-binding SARP family transcriptional activator/Tfp pilus assembly protein PilF